MISSSYERIVVKFCGWAESGQRTNHSNFGVSPIENLDPGFLNPNIYPRAGGTELAGQSGVSGPTFHQCYRATSAAPQVACSSPDQLQAFIHHIQDVINWQPGLPTSRLSTSKHRTNCYLLTVPRMALALSAKAFSVSTPSVCNSLLYYCRSAELLSTFKRSLSLWLIGTVRAEPETVISRAWVQSPHPAELIVSGLLARML